MTCVKLSYWLQACRYGISLRNSSPLCCGRFSSVPVAWDGIGRKVLLHCVHAVLAKDCIEPFRTFVQIKKKLQTFFPPYKVVYPVSILILCVHFNFYFPALH